MLSYVLMRADVTDPVQHGSSKAVAAKAIENHGGRYWVRGCASAPWKVISTPGRVA
jgi:uncharacterized protein (DUF1330 family)